MSRTVERLIDLAARLAVGLLAALFASGCCSSTWFRSRGPAQEPIPVPLSSAGEFQGETFAFSWVPRRGALLVTVTDLPEGRWLVQARRPRGWVVGEMEILVPGGTSLTEIEIWPFAGRLIAPDSFPVFQRVPLNNLSRFVSSETLGTVSIPLAFHYVSGGES